MPAAQAPGQPGEARPPGLLKFRIKRNLGVGVSGLVVAAETVGPETGGLPQDLALKLLHPFLQTDSPSEEERINEECFIKEAKQMAKLSCPYIIAGYGLIHCPPNTPGFPKDCANSARAMALEFMEAGSLARMLFKTMTEGRSLYTNQEAYQILLDVAMGLLYLHSQTPAIAHRDLKMENLLLTRRHGRLQCKIADLGLHAVMDRTQHQSLLRRKASCAVPDAPGKQPRLFFAHTDAEAYTERNSLDDQSVCSTPAGRSHTAVSEVVCEGTPVDSVAPAAKSQAPTVPPLQLKTATEGATVAAAAKAEAAPAAATAATAAVATDTQQQTTGAVAVAAATGPPARPAGLLTRIMSGVRSSFEKQHPAATHTAAPATAAVTIGPQSDRAPDFASPASQVEALPVVPQVPPVTCPLSDPTGHVSQVAVPLPAIAAGNLSGRSAAVAVDISMAARPLRPISYDGRSSDSAGVTPVDKPLAAALWETQDTLPTVLPGSVLTNQQTTDATKGTELVTFVNAAFDMAVSPPRGRHTAGVRAMQGGTPFATPHLADGGEGEGRGGRDASVPMPPVTKLRVTEPQDSGSEDDMGLALPLPPPAVLRQSSDKASAHASQHSTPGRKAGVRPRAKQGSLGGGTSVEASPEKAGHGVLVSEPQVAKAVRNAYGSGPGVNSQTVIAAEAGDSLRPLPNDRSPGLGAALAKVGPGALGGENGAGSGGVTKTVNFTSRASFKMLTLDIPDPTHTAPAFATPQAHRGAGSLGQVDTNPLYTTRAIPMARALTLAGKRSLYHFSPPSPDQSRLLSHAAADEHHDPAPNPGSTGSAVLGRMKRSLSKLGIHTLAHRHSDNPDTTQQETPHTTAVTSKALQSQSLHGRVGGSVEGKGPGAPTPANAVRQLPLTPAPTPRVPSDAHAALRASEEAASPVAAAAERLRTYKRPVKRVLSPEFAFVYNLTGSTGSSMYMAPEVCRHEPYNESVDTYSFAVVMYEVLSRTMLIFTHVGQGRVAEDADGYAEAASKGYRPEQPPRLDPSAWELITACWAQDPLERPPMNDVVRRLQDIIARLPHEEPISQGCCRMC